MKAILQQMLKTLDKFESCQAVEKLSDFELKYLKELRIQIEQLPIQEPNKTTVFNQEVIGCNVIADTVVFNGDSKNITVDANQVIFNDSCKEVTIEYAKEIVNNA